MAILVSSFLIPAYAKVASPVASHSSAAVVVCAANNEDSLVRIVILFSNDIPIY